jgi:hypothetical protein
MMPRRQHGEVHFGNDSFLDVVANIVGVMVILIVIAGLRVTQGDLLVPTKPDEKMALAAPTIDDLPIMPMLAADPPPRTTVTVKMPRPESRPVVRAPVLPPEPPADLVHEERQLAAELQNIRTRLGQSQVGVQKERTELAKLNGDVARLQSQVDADDESLSSNASRLERLKDDLNQTAQQVDALRRQLDEAEKEPPRTQKFRHRVTPVARLVEGNEIHFRLKGNRVSVVPVESLAERLQDHLMRHREAVLKLERYEGTVGPVEGYRMEYLVERQSASLLDELKSGPGTIRFGVSRWVIHPDKNLPEETADLALRADSRFVGALRKAGPRTTLTFWVYPDSFELHRALQEAAHENGFDVAARPLPAGVPITGSPNGARSFAQ